MSKGKADYDVGIIGGGPAGAGLAAYLARAGVRCVVFESARFPRPHVGESLVPSSTRVFRDLDFLATVESAGFPRKYGAAWTSAGNSQLYNHTWQGLAADTTADVRFGERPQPGVEQDYTWHVDRGVFDALLLRHARTCGADVFEDSAVREVHFAPDRLPELRVGRDSGETTYRVRIVADASGRRTFLGSRLRIKVKDPCFDQYALHTWFEGFDRRVVLPESLEKQDYIYIHFLPLTNSWIWQIPISDSITSIGVVTQKASFSSVRQERETFFWSCVDTRPELGRALRAARQVRPLAEEGDYSYAMTRICGDGWLMLGDAARFVDPIFSTGVSIALNSARFAHRDILAALRSGDTGRASFATYEAHMRRGTNNWYEFITLYYRLNVLFTYFIRNPEYRLDVLKLLQGDVYDEEKPLVLDRMRAMVTDVEQNPSHPLHGLLNNLTADAFKPAF